MSIVPRIRTIVAATGLVLAVGIAPAQASQNSSRAGAVVQGQNQAAPAERRICVRSQMTGTRMVRTICKTKAEWDRSGGMEND